jgi:hypothetical protein
MLFPDETLTYAVARLFLKTSASDIVAPIEMCGNFSPVQINKYVKT